LTSIALILAEVHDDPPTDDVADVLMATAGLGPVPAKDRLNGRPGGGIGNIVELDTLVLEALPRSRSRDSWRWKRSGQVAGL
jgi:hypothetical protein